MLGDLPGVAVGPNVEAQDDGARRFCERHIVLGDRANRAVDDPHGDLFHLHLLERVLNGLQGPLNVRLQDHVQLCELAFACLLVQVFQRYRLPRDHVGDAAAALTVLRDLPGGALIGSGPEVVAGFRNRVEPQHLRRAARSCLVQRLSVVVEHRAHASPCGAAHDRG